MDPMDNEQVRKSVATGVRLAPRSSEDNRLDATHLELDNWLDSLSAKKHNMNPYSIQGYRVILHIPQNVPDDLRALGGIWTSPTYAPSPTMIFDTGSSTTWIYGYNFHEIVLSGPEPPLEKLGPARRNLRAAQAVDHAFLLNHPYRLKPTEKILADVKHNDQIAMQEYEDGTMAYHTIGEDLESVSITSAYKGTKLSTASSPITMKFRFAVAIAATRTLYTRPLGGVLALGLKRYQAVFPMKYADEL